MAFEKIFFEGLTFDDVLLMPEKIIVRLLYKGALYEVVY